MEHICINTLNYDITNSTSSSTSEIACYVADGGAFKWLRSVCQEDPSGEPAIDRIERPNVHRHEEWRIFK